MCGICGIYNFTGAPVEQQLIEAMNESMVLRGPDDSGTYIKDFFGMAMRRLSIIDLVGGHQPISNEDGTIWVIQNGEIYNYIELRQDLEQRGHLFVTDSDTEVLVHLYEEYGLEAVNRLNGMFAFALWDLKKKRLWLVRDRLGIKPLVYFEHAGGLVFASNLLALAKHPAFTKEIDRDSLLLYFSLAYVPTPRTIWKQAKKIPPGHWMIVENGQCQLKKYWHPESVLSSVGNSIEFVEEATSILNQSTELHSRSDVPVGTFLSGGIDSSLVTALFCKHSEQEINTFTMNFVGKSDNGSSFAQIVADQYRTKHHLHSLSLSTALETLAELVPLMDEPMADSAIVPSYLLSRAAQANGIKVVLCGAGGDELFGGYQRHYCRKRDHLAGALPFIPLHIWLGASKLLMKNLTHYGMLTWDAGTRFAVSTSGIHLGLFAKMLNNHDDFIRSMQLTQSQFAQIKNFKELNGWSQGRMLIDLNNYLLDNVLALTDRASMAASVEARVPLLDHRLVELVFGTNPAWYLGNDFSKSKQTLKQIAQPYIDSELLKLPKTGFNAPVKEWMGQEVESIKDRVIKPRSYLLQEIFSAKSIEYIWRNSTFRREASESLFMIYMADIWLEHHA